MAGTPGIPGSLVSRAPSSGRTPNGSEVAAPSGRRTRAPGTRPPGLAPGFSLELATSGPLRDQAERFEYQIFRTSEFCVPAACQRVMEYEPFRDTSLYHIILDPEGEVVGLIRAIVGPLDELPMGVLERDTTLPVERVCEVASIAVKPGVRGGDVAEVLFRNVWAEARRAGASGLVAAVDQWLFDLFNDYYKFAFRQIGPVAEDYMGPPVVPIGFRFEDCEASLIEHRPGFYEWLLESLTPSEAVAMDLLIAV